MTSTELAKDHLQSALKLSGSSEDFLKLVTDLVSELFPAVPEEGAALPADAVTVEFAEIEIPPRELALAMATVPEGVKLFRGTKLIATETMDVGILCAIINDRCQMPLMATGLNGIMSIFYGPNSVGSGVAWSTWDVEQPFVILLRNNSDAPVKWSAKVEGKGAGMVEGKGR